MKIQPPKSEAVKFIYQETQIHFLINPTDENVMVNATEMSKIFGKEPKDFLRLDGTKKFIDRLIEIKNIVADVPRYNKENIIYSNNKAGTYMNRFLALKFAAWLDVDFEIWIFSTIDEILFGKYNIHRKKTLEIENSKSNLETLKKQLINNQDETAIKFLEEQENLKQLKKARTKAIVEQTKSIQLKFFV